MKSATNAGLNSSPVLWCTFAAAVLAAASTISAARPAYARAAARAVAPAHSGSADASGGLAPDKGTFRILVSGDEVGKEQFEIASDGGSWTIHGTTEIRSGKTSTHIIGALTIRPDGTPVRYTWSTDGAKKASATVNFNGPTVTTELHTGAAQPFTQQFTFPSPHIVVLDNNLYEQYAVVADLYDWNKKGAQTFPVLVPQELTPGSATVESMGQQDFNGKKLEELRVTTQDNEIDLYLDGSRLMGISVPSANAEIVRQ
jgi:hypothetical protein